MALDPLSLLRHHPLVRFCHCRRRFGRLGYSIVVEFV